MKTESLCIYPTPKDIIPIMKYIHKLNPSYEVKKVVGFDWLGHVGKDIAYIDNRDNLGYMISANLEESLFECDTLFVPFLCEMYSNDQELKLVLSAIAKAMMMQKNVACIQKLSVYHVKKFQKLAKEKGVIFSYLYPKSKPVKNKSENVPVKLYNPSSPIIFVGGMVEEADNFEVFLWLITKFRENGFKAAGLCDSPYSDILDFQMLSDNHLDEKPDDIIRSYNKLFFDIEKADHPDLFVVMMPGAMMKYSDTIANDFGVQSYMLSQAVTPNFFIYCSLFGFSDTVFWKGINDNLSSKMGYSIDALHMSNKFVESIESAGTYTLSYLCVPQSEVSSVLENSTHPSEMYNFLDDCEQEKIYEVVKENIFSNGCEIL